VSSVTLGPPASLLALFHRNPPNREEPVDRRFIAGGLGAILAPQFSCPVRGAVESVVTLLEADDDARGTAARADSVSTVPVKT